MVATGIIETAPVVFRFYVPAKPLSEFVSVFWYWRGHEVPYSKQRILPMATAELVINLGCGPTSNAGISGPHSQSFMIERTVQDELLGIHFHFGGAFPFLEFPFGELHGLHVTLADLWGPRKADRLLSILHESKTVERKFQVLEGWLMQVASRPLKHHRAVGLAIREFQNDPGLLSSAVVAEKVNLSQRRFIQMFRDEIGLTPKLFCRSSDFKKSSRWLKSSTLWTGSTSRFRAATSINRISITISASSAD